MRSSIIFFVFNYSIHHAFSVTNPRRFSVPVLFVDSFDHMMCCRNYYVLLDFSFLVVQRASTVLVPPFYLWNNNSNSNNLITFSLGQFIRTFSTNLKKNIWPSCKLFNGNSFNVVGFEFHSSPVWISSVLTLCCGNVPFTWDSNNLVSTSFLPVWNRFFATYLSKFYVVFRNSRHICKNCFDILFFYNFNRKINV